MARKRDNAIPNGRKTDQSKGDRINVGNVKFQLTGEKTVVSISVEFPTSLAEDINQICMHLPHDNLDVVLVRPTEINITANFVKTDEVSELNEFASFVREKALIISHMIVFRHTYMEFIDSLIQRAKNIELDAQRVIYVDHEPHKENGDDK